MYVLTWEGLGQEFERDLLAQSESASEEETKYQRILETIKSELQLKFTDPNDPGLYRRRLRLRELFKAAPPSKAQALYDQLQRKDDPLAQLFHYRLATATRNEMLGILSQIISAPRPQAPRPTLPPAPQPTPSTETIPFGLTVVDENDKNLSGEKYVIYQNGKKVEEGVLNNGQAFFTKINKSKPFKFEVEGRVCAITEGAVLLTDEPGVEYGGTFFDWSIADDQREAKANTFWKEYGRERFKRPDGPSSFWQHDHITRRSIQIRKKYLNEIPKRAVVIKAIPVQIRVGPLVRYTSHDTAVIWVELETPGLVRVIYKRSHSQSGYEGIAHSATVRVGGRHYAAVSISGLSEDTTYNYTLELAPLPAEGRIPVEESDFTKVFPQLSKPILDNTKKQLRVCSVDNNEWLSFCTLRQRYDQYLRFAYGSCQNLSKPGPDALEAFGIALDKTPRHNWPSFLLLCGDQIYADDIATEQGQAITKQRFGARNPGPQDRDEISDGAWAGRFAHRFLGVSVKKIQAEAKTINTFRNQLDQLQKQINQTRSIESARKMAKLSDAYHEFMELSALRSPVNGLYVAANAEILPGRFRYLVRNHLLWKIPVDKKDIPILTQFGLRNQDGSRYRSAGGGEIRAADFAEYAYLYEMTWATPKPVRQVLANLPTFMVFDDHEIADDWNFNNNWVEIIHTDKDPWQYWPKTIADGLAAYWIYQGWGNLAPSKWSNDPRTKILLDARSKGIDALVELRKLILKQAVKPPSKLDWHYELPISPLFMVLDLRTKRILDPKDDARSQIMDPGQFRWLQERLERTSQPAAFVVSSVPFLLTELMMIGQELTTKWDLEKMRRDWDIEHWPADMSWVKFRDILQHLTNRRRKDPNFPLKTIVALSGDVHFSYNMLGYLTQTVPKEMRYKFHSRIAHDTGRGTFLGEPKVALFPELLNLVCSGLRNRPDERKKRNIERANRASSNRFSFRGMEIIRGGFEQRKEAVVTDYNIALVEVWFVEEPKRSGKLQFVLQEDYFMVGSSKEMKSAGKFIYETTDQFDLYKPPSTWGLSRLTEPPQLNSHANI